MKKLLFIFTFFLPALAPGQSGNTGNNTQVISGSVEIPVLQSVKVEIINKDPLKFTTPEEIENGIVRPGFYRLTVISNVPWVVNVMANGVFLNSSNINSSGQASVSMVEVRGNTGGFIPLTNNPQTIFVSSNNNIKNVYEVDLRIKPSVLTSWGKYNSGISFSITPQ